ncbi:ABC transporter permease subunit, partial [Pseudomonas viridiflava]
MGYWTRTRKIVLPQALINMLPSMVGQFVTTIKDTSLGYVIGVNELTYAANQVNSSVITEPFSVFLVLSLAYFVICFTLTQAARLLEARLERRYTRTVAQIPQNAQNAPV